MGSPCIMKSWTKKAPMAIPSNMIAPKTETEGMSMQSALTISRQPVK